MPERLVLCGGAKRPGSDSALRLGLDGGFQNITLRVEDISKKLVKDVPDLLVDLIEIATYVYCADRATSRGGEAQAGMGSAWRRNFRFVIPVRQPDHWNHDNVSEALRAALSFLSEDDYAFEFDKASDPAPMERYLDLSEEEGATLKAGEVVLFSGGLDSLGGTVEELSTNTEGLALVSHRSSSKIFDHQKALVRELKHRFPNRVMHVPVLVTRQESLQAGEYTQRSRSFLYLALACAVACLFGNKRIRFFENGVVSINLPISEQVVGARATRTTHPLALKRFRDLLKAVVGQPIELDNPFIWKTKADVIRGIVDHRCGPLIRHTVSCTRTYDITRLHTHCGCCSQCLDRRFAVLAADAAEHDPVEMYKVELLAGSRERPNDKTMAESYLRTALELRGITEFGFFDRFSGETARVCSGFPTQKPDDVARQVLDLHQRHGQAIWDVLRAAIAQLSAELVDRAVPPSSLLIMAVVPGQSQASAAAVNHAGAIEKWFRDAEVGSEPIRTQRAMEKQTSTPVSEHLQRGRRSPALELVQDALKKLYPGGVPDQTTERNANLCRKVGDWLKTNKMADVSDATILRAAGRRK